MARKTRKAYSESAETKTAKAIADREIELYLAKQDIDLYRASLLEAENDVLEAQERVVSETEHYEHACAVYADLLSGRRKTR